MNFLVQLAWAVFFAVASRAFASKPNQPAPERATINDVDAPLISEGATVPVFAGTVKLDGQNVSWFGGLGADAITQQGVVTGYKYRLTVQLTFGFGPIDGIKEIRFEDNVAPYTATDSTDYVDLAVNSPDLFGGDDKEGGVSGTLRVYKGTTTQTRDIEVNTLVGAETPAYRRVCYAVARNFYWGTSPRLKPFSLVAQRWPNQLAIPDGKHRIGADDCNPVAFLFEILTDTTWGAAEPTDRFDLASWRAAAVQVHAEGLGVSMRFAQGSSTEDIRKTLLKYIDGTIYEDPATGNYHLLLVRDMLDSNLPVLDKQHVSSVSLTRISWTELKNTVKVTFTDRARNYETGAVQAQNSATLASFGNVIDSEQIDLPGFHGSAPAAFVAGRSLKALSYPMAKAQIVGDRSLAAFRPGQAIRLVWERPNVSATFRVQSINYGGLGNRAVTIEAIEDAFSTASASFQVPPASQWEPTDGGAQSVTQVLLQEQPYRWTQASTRSLLFAAAAPTAAHTGFSAIVDGGTPVDGLFAARSTMTTALAQWTGAEVNLTLGGLSLPESVVSPNAAQYDAGDAVLVIDDEWLAYRTLTRNPDGTVTFGQCARGAFDTVPAGHVPGATVWVLASGALRLTGAYGTDTAHTVAAPTRTLADAQTDSEGAVTTITTASRAARPAPPGQVTLNGLSYPTSVTGPVVVGWATRTRLATQVVLQSAGNQGTDGATSYHVRAYDAAGTLLHSHTTATGATSYTLPGTLSGDVSIHLLSSNGSLDSLYPHIITVNVLAPIQAEDGTGLQAEDATILYLE